MQKSIMDDYVHGQLIKLEVAVLSVSKFILPRERQKEHEKLNQLFNEGFKSKPFGY